jgi:hypothetical protein
VTPKRDRCCLCGAWRESEELEPFGSRHGTYGFICRDSLACLRRQYRRKVARAIDRSGRRPPPRLPEPLSHYMAEARTAARAAAERRAAS